MPLNSVSGPYPIAHSFFLKWMYLKDTNMQAGVYVPILYSRGIELSWMLKSAAVRVMQQTGVVNNGPAVQADD